MSDPTWNSNIQRSCGVLYFHFFFGIVLIILGWTAVASRWIIRLKPYHRNMGQLWVYGMIIQIYTSTYVSYNGFRWFIFMFGVICYGSLIIAHFMIRKLQRNENEKQKRYGLMTHQLKYVPPPEEPDDSSHSNREDIDTQRGNEEDSHLNEDVRKVTSGTFENISKADDSWLTQYRLKVLHGAFMVLSLIMLTGAGAAFVRRFSSTSECQNIYCDPDGDGFLPDCFIE